MGEKICQERPGICSIQRKACEDILNQEFEQMCAPGNVFGKLRAAVLRRRLEGSSYRAEKKLQELTDTVAGAAGAENTMDLIRLVDKLYNRLWSPSFEAVHGNLEKVLAVSIKELTEYPWEVISRKSCMRKLWKAIWSSLPEI